MFQRILVPLDGSSRAEQVLPIALRLAGASGGSLVLLRVISTATEWWPLLPDPSSFASIAIHSEVAEAEHYLAQVQTCLRRQHVDIAAVSRIGPVVATILQVASEEQVDLVVFGSHGYTESIRQMIGSVTEQVACRSSVPVLILREGGPMFAGSYPDTSRPLRLLVPLDGSPQAKAALAPAIKLVTALATPGTGALHLTRVISPASSHQEQARLLQHAKDDLCTTIEQLRTEGSASNIALLQLALTWSVAVDTHVAEAIVRVAEMGEDTEGVSPPGGCQAIVLATHGCSRVSVLSMGSVAARVLNSTKRPLLMVRPPVPTTQECVSGAAAKSAMLRS